MSKVLVKSIDEVYGEQTVSKGFKSEDVKLTKDELKQMLDVTIESRSKYKLMCFYPELERQHNVVEEVYPAMPSPSSVKAITSKDVRDIAATVYKNIVSDFRYDSNMVLATRAVKFNEEYVREIVTESNKRLAAKAKDMTVGKAEEDGLYIHLRK